MFKTAMFILLAILLANASFFHNVIKVDATNAESMQALEEARTMADSLPLLGTVSSSQYLIRNNYGDPWGIEGAHVRGTLVTLNSKELIGITSIFDHIEEGTEIRGVRNIDAESIICLKSLKTTNCSYELNVTSF